LHAVHGGAVDVLFLHGELEELLQRPEAVRRGRRLGAGVELGHERLYVLAPDRQHGGRHAGTFEEGGELIDRSR